MKKTEKAIIIKEYLDEILPFANCSLEYNDDYQLLIAVMLSAQTTDKAVNSVTRELFSKYKTLEELNSASFDDIFCFVSKLGLAKIKTNNIKSITKDLINKYSGKVPYDKDELMSMSGIGNKTANVIRIELFDIPEMPVDTHIHRISKRLDIIKENESVMIAEINLKKMFNPNYYKKLHHQLILFGRTICKAQNPLCEKCKLHDICKYYKKNSSSTTER